MSGTSCLAVAQWFTAAEQPPHLVAINPWEGVSDVYRDLVMRGGMPDTGFAAQLQDGSFFGRNRKEDVLSEVEAHPWMGQLWEQKIPDFDKITVPAYVVASYSNTLHTAGTFRAWRRMGSTEKWLRIHNTQEWPDYYDAANVEDLRHFFDHYLKGVDNGWETTPRVRYAVLDLEGGDEVAVPAESFPPPGSTSTRHYLDAQTRSLAESPPPDAAEAAYAVDASPAAVSFLARFDQETVLVGYRRLTCSSRPAALTTWTCSCWWKSLTGGALLCRRLPCRTSPREPTTSPTTARRSCAIRVPMDGFASPRVTSTRR